MSPLQLAPSLLLLRSETGVFRRRGAERPELPSRGRRAWRISGRSDVGDGAAVSGPRLPF